MKEKTFKVKGMHCASCEMLIKDSLEEQKGVASAQASFKDGSVKVKYDEKLATDDIIKSLIKKEGYKVE